MIGLFVLIMLCGFFLLVVALCKTSWQSGVISNRDWIEFLKRQKEIKEKNEKESDKA